MGVSGGPYIVRDSSLVLELDAADRNSYISGSTIWRDLTANSFTGSLINGPTFSSASLGNIVFDGTNDYVNFGNPTILSFPGDFTIDVWAKVNDITSIYGGTILGKRTASTFINNYSLYFANGAFLFGINGNTNIAITGSASGLSYNSWYNVTSTVSGSMMYLYINSSLQPNSSSIPGGTIIDNNAPLRIGQNHDLNAPLSGSVSNVRLYNRGLSPSEILQNYNALKSRFNL